MLTSGIHGAVPGWNAISLTNTYNNRLQLSQSLAVSPVPSTLLSLSYSYDQGGGVNNGSVMQITNGRDSTRSVSYSYDQLNRLSTAQTSSTWGDSYTYDAWGNLLQKTVIKGTAESMLLTVNNKNQIISPAFTYDAAGDVTWDTTHALNYNAEGRMTPASGETYTYDGDGRRVLKSDGTIYWIDDHLRPLSVGTTSGSISRDYIFLGSQRIAMVPLSSGNPYYYLSDHLGSTAVIASGDGKAIQWEADYFPFGAVRQVLTNVVGNNYEFTGYENDSETDYNYANARYEAGRWGRFLSPDPFLGSADVTNSQSLNRYSYVLNSPLRLIDPTGLQCVWDDGSFDAEDDPDTGSVGGCQEQGGTWIELGGPSGSWSEQANGTLGQLVSDVANGRANIISATDSNGQNWITRYDDQGRVQWTAGGGFDTFYSYFAGEISPSGVNTQYDPQNNVANGYSQYVQAHPGLPLNLDDRYEMQMVRQMAEFGSLDTSLSFEERVCASGAIAGAGLSVLAFGIEGKAAVATLNALGAVSAAGGLACIFM